MKRLAAAILLLSALLTGGCIREDLSACHGRFSLRFSYTGDGPSEMFGEKIEKVDLYVFDSDNHLVKSESLERRQLGSEPVAHLDLPPGNYSVVSIGNQHDNTAVVGIGDGTPCDMGSVLMGHPCAFDGGRMTGNDSLYMAACDISVPSMGEAQATAVFAASHFDMSVEVRGTDPATTRLELRHPWPHTNFNNQPCGNACVYYPETEAAAKSASVTLVSRFNVNRFSEADDVLLDITDQAGNNLHTVDISQFVATTGIDIGKQEVLIPVLVEFKSIGVTVSIPEWATEVIEPEF